MKHIKTFKVTPMGKPRMIASDKWKKRKCVEKYWAYKDKILAQSNGFILPDSNVRIVFYFPMPKSWSEKSKKLMMNKPHKQKPDVDNCGKGLMDILCKEDKHIWDIHITKLWSDAGQIDIYKMIASNEKEEC